MFEPTDDQPDIWWYCKKGGPGTWEEFGQPTEVTSKSKGLEAITEILTKGGDMKEAANEDQQHGFVTTKVYKHGTLSCHQYQGMLM